ncbi:tetratricopeptide repeat protein [Streptomyces sp. NPDC050535]|uniref:tetratricopeptide repeat protein n=1 Tax=Streptomyces sp. NPDC050535 TaxID=3365626 RepID=UPI0037938BD8
MELLLLARELAVARQFRASRMLVRRVRPRSAEELTLAASVLVELRDPKAALPLARRAVELAPDDWRGHLVVADATFQQRSWDESVAAARRAVELGPEEAAAHRALGVALNRRIGDGREARREIRRARELGGRAALRTPGRRGAWWFLLFVPLAVAAGLSVADWPGGVGGLLDVSRALFFMVCLLLVFTRPSRAGLTWSERIAELRAARARPAEPGKGAADG